MSASLRQIAPMPNLLMGAKPELNLGGTPELLWVDPTEIWVDAEYQRDLTERSLQMLRKVVREFRWAKMKPPIVVRTEGKLHCINGQHTAIGAATLGIKLIPVFLVQADTQAERAESFVSHNSNQVIITALDVYKAKIAAGDEDALDTRNVCERAGVRLRQLNPKAKIMVGDCASIGKIQTLVKRRGVVIARKVLESLVKGGRSPIAAAEIDAMEATHLMLRPEVTVEEMALVVKALGYTGVLRAKMAASEKEIPHKHQLYLDYTAHLEKMTGVKRRVAK